MLFYILNNYLIYRLKMPISNFQVLFLWAKNYAFEIDGMSLFHYELSMRSCNLMFASEYMGNLSIS